MAANRVEQAKAQAEAKGGDQTAAAAAPAAAKPSGGIGPWIPLIANVVLMPVVAWSVATFVIVPKIRSSPVKAAPAEAAKPEGAAEEGHAKEGAPGGKILAPLSEKILVNLSGSLGTRYLVAKMTLVGRSADFKEQVEKSDAQLRDAAAGALATKTIADLERPDSRNVIRGELLAVFNDILGKGSVSEIFLTEFAIQ